MANTKCKHYAYCEQKEKYMDVPGYCVECGECATFDICPGRKWYGVTENSHQCFCCGYRVED